MCGIKIIYLIVSFILVNKNAFSQAEKCDTIYSNPDSLAVFEGGFNNLKDITLNELIPIIYLKCSNEIELPSSLKIRFTINSFGEVIDLKMIRPNPENFSDYCINEFYTKAKSIKGFKAASHNGIPVCSYYIFPINCIKWN